MNPWIGSAVFLVGMVVCVAIRVPHDKRSKEVKIAESRKGALEKTLLALMAITGFILPLMFMVSPACLEQVGQMMLTLSAKSSSALS